MMVAEKSLRLGNLKEALAELQNQVRKEPADPKLRVFLFQLLTVQGNWDRALTQLNVAGELDASTLAMVQTYREAIRCEKVRQAVFGGQEKPLILGEPGQWLALLLEALRLDAGEHFGQATELRQQALELAPASSGTIDGIDFEWIADADCRFGPCLEAVVNGQYCWIPFQNIQKIVLDKPADLRDVVWMPAQFVWANGGESVGLIPSRYPGSESSEDAQILMAHKTQWLEKFEGLSWGWGQRLLATNIDDYALLDIREIQLNPSV
ncbi:MAG: hypothetical protein RL563_1719 [Pseudomonadota bacterium]|jgi:type VI secretion system protein ImpE